MKHVHCLCPNKWMMMVVVVVVVMMACIVFDYCIVTCPSGVITTVCMGHVRERRTMSAHVTLAGRVRSATSTVDVTTTARVQMVLGSVTYVSISRPAMTARNAVQEHLEVLLQR